MKSKKIASLILAAVLALSLAVPAFAATKDLEGSLSDVNQGANFSFDATVETATIKVTVPADDDAARVVLNPYRKTVAIDTNGEKNTGTNVTDQVISVARTITNASDVPIQVSYTATATAVGEGVSIATAALKDTAVGKQILLFCETQVPEGTTAPDADTWAKAYDSKATNQVLFSTKGASPKTAIALSEPGADTDTSVLYYKIGGAMPTVTDSEWAEGDGVTIGLAFTFKVGALAVEEA